MLSFVELMVRVELLLLSLISLPVSLSSFLVSVVMDDGTDTDARERDWNGDVAAVIVAQKI